MAGTTRGATSLGDGGGKRKKRGGLLWLLLGLLLLALVAGLLLALLQGDGDKKKSTASTTSTQQQEQASPTGGARAGAGSLTAGRESLLPPPGQLPSGTLGEQAQGREVTIQEINPSEGFWVGTSATDRVYIEYGSNVGETESGSESFEPEVGQKVNLEGEVRPAPAEPGQTLNLRKPDDAALVKKQGFFVNATDVQPAA